MLALAIPAAIVAIAPSPPATSCGPSPVIQTSSTAPPGLKRLGDLPDGQLMRAVLFQVGPCSMKIVREPAGFRPGVWRFEADVPLSTKPTPATSR